MKQPLTTYHKRMCFLMLCCIFTSLLSVAQVSKSVTIVAGDLSSKLTETEKNTITELTISGTIDARDFKTMRDSIPSLTVIDLSKVTITAYSGILGTNTYHLNDTIYNENSIPAFAFSDNDNLVLISIPSSVTSIGLAAFDDCDYLETIDIPVTSSLRYIGDYAFKYCAMDSIFIPNSVTYIGEEAFSRCENLMSVIIPTSVSLIGIYAFANCPAYITVDAKNQNYKSIEGVLYNKLATLLIQCPTSITGSFTIPSSVTSVGPAAFDYCIHLKSILIPESVEQIGSEAFYNCRNLETINLPSKITEIESNVFTNCSSLKSIIYPPTLHKIRHEAFENCSSLESFVIPNLIDTIEYGTFKGCTKLSKVSIPYVYEIEREAFSDCPNIDSIFIETILPLYGERVFTNTPISDIVLIVPKGSKTAYQGNLHWNGFGNIIESSNNLWSNGNGTDLDPWQIHNIKDLKKLSHSVAAGTDQVKNFHNGEYFILMSNIDTQGNFANAWMPIGGRNASNAAGMDNYFSGTFDGNGYTLSNLYINSTSKNFTGLFGYIKSATIKNLGIIGECSINGGANTGGIVGFANTQSTIVNCYTSIATGQIKENGAGGSGGIAGALFGSSIASNCYNKSNVAGGNFIGGIAGWVQDGSLISNCFNTGKVESKSGQGIGGIAGQFSGSTINYCYNTGSVTGGSNLGALAGACYNGTIQNAYFNKTTSVQTKAAGYQSGTNNITATGLTTAEMQDKSLVDKLNQGQSAVWMTDGTPQTNNGYPILLSNATVNTTVITSSPSLVYSFGADLNGYIYVGKNKVLSYGFEFKSKNATQYTLMESTLNGVFLKTEASGLMPGSDYTYRAFAVTATDTLRAEPVNFSTPKCAILSYTRKVGNDGKNTLKFSGNGFHENVVVKLAKAGRDTLVSETVSSERYNCSALFDFTKKEKGYWDIIVDFKGTTIVIKKGLEIEEAIPGELKIEIVGNNRALIGREADFTIKVYNTGNLAKKNACIEVAVDSDDPEFKVFSKEFDPVDKELFEGLGFDVREFSFIETDNVFDRNRNCKIGMFFLPDLTAYGSCDIIVSVKSKKDYSISTWESSYSLDNFSDDIVSMFIADTVAQSNSKSASILKSSSENICESIYAKCYKDWMDNVNSAFMKEASSSLLGFIPIESAKLIAKSTYNSLLLYKEMSKGLDGNVPGEAKEIIIGEVKNAFTDITKLGLQNIAAKKELAAAIDGGIIRMMVINGKAKTMAEAKNIFMKNSLKTLGKASLVGDILGNLISYGGVYALTEYKARKSCYTPVLKDCLPDDIKKHNVRAVSSMDPNDKIGYRSPSGSTYFNDKRTNFTYIINFENKSTATAPAHEVFVTDTLDMKSFNVSSFRAGYIKIGETITQAPYNVKNHKWEVDLRPKRDIKVEVTVTLDSIKGIAKWYFKTIDPTTNDLPSDPDMGFLQPNDSTGRGQGCVTFTIDLNESVTNESEVNNRATIVFDYNAPIMTPTWSNKKDIVAPTSNIFEPDIVGDNKALISWEGEDNKNGSGVYCYNLYVKKGNENYTPLLQRTALTSIDFEFEKDVKYSFYVTAIDSAENVEIKTNVPEINLEITEVFAISKKWDDVLVCNNTGSKYTSYQWYKNGNPIQGANEQFYQETGGLNGSYFVMVTTTDGKIGISNVISAGNSTKSVKVYPNPLEERKEYTVEIKAEESELTGGEMIVTNINGQIISRRKQLQPLNKLDGMSRGVYLVKVQFANGESFNDKLIVK